MTMPMPSTALLRCCWASCCQLPAQLPPATPHTPPTLALALLAVAACLPLSLRYASNGRLDITDSSVRAGTGRPPRAPRVLGECNYGGVK